MTKLLYFLGGSAWAATAISGIPQALQVYHNGHARGINVTMVMLLIYGVACSMTYTYLKYGFDVVLLGKGFFTLLIWGFIGSYLL